MAGPWRITASNELADSNLVFYDPHPLKLRGVSSDWFPRQLTSTATMLNRFAIEMLTASAMIALAGGCQFPWPGANSSASLADTSLPFEAAETAHTPGSTLTSNPSEVIQTSSVASAKTQQEAMAEVLDELQAIGAIDPTAQRQLMADLREAKPENWPMIVHQFQSALAYRQQLAARESQTEPNLDSPPQTAGVPMAPPATNDVHKATATLPSSENVPGESSVEKPSAITPAAAEAKNSLKTIVPAVGNDDSANDSTESSPLPAHPDGRVATPLVSPQHSAVEQASYATPIVDPASQPDHLQAAIAELEQSANPSPASIEDVHQHMRLRLLRLLAGQENDALQPIPGATSTQQDYWSQQLFAVSTFLDNARQPDDKRRAAGSLVYLDRARADLAELATLQVRNLAFVKSVDGFGAYEVVEEAKFRPGDQVTLYLEVENFRSESTKEGYRTALGTSYEVLDQKGQRVDGAQFPDVEDLCKNQRRDFHMQYGIALPTRIYAGEYQLRLTITDQLSHKIGQTSVPFEIVE